MPCDLGFSFDPATIRTNASLAFALAPVLPIFPCDNTKAPLPGTPWKSARPGQIERVQRWWADDPDAMPALHLGAVGLIVIDADGAAGTAAFEAICEPHGGVPECPMVDTPSGGRHYYFKQWAGEALGNSRGALPPKDVCPIDVRGDGGYVIAPDATREDGIYAIPDGDPLDILTAPTLPDWLHDILTGSREEISPEPSNQNALAPVTAPKEITLPPTQIDMDNPRLRAWVESAFQQEIQALAQAGKGGRNEQLNRSAFAVYQLVAAGWIKDEHAHAALMDAASVCGLLKDDGRKQVLATIASGKRGGLGQPRQVPDEFVRDEEMAADAIALNRALAMSDDGTVYDAETGEIVSQDARSPPTAKPSKPVAPLKLTRFSDRLGETPPARRWIIRDWVPAEGEVTGLYGDGGIGKTLLAQLTQALLALGRPWFGHDARPVRSIGFYCEDSSNELWRRRHRIMRHLFGEGGPGGEEAEMLAGALDCSRVGEDNLLMVFNRQGQGEVTAFQRQIIECARDENAKLVILDNAATLFPGDAINASQVRQFVDVACGGIASAIGGSVILCAHPSKAGMSTGTGDSGSVQWNAAFRSRLFLHHPKVDGIEDRTTLLLSRMKGNYANVFSDVEIPLRWTPGGVLALNAPEGEDGRPSASEAFLRCLDARVAELRFVSDKARGSTYAPKIFASMPQAFGYTASHFVQAMDALFLTGEIELAAIYGVDRHVREAILRPGQCMEFRAPPSRKFSDPGCEEE